MVEKMETLPEIQENATTEAERLGVAWDDVYIKIGALLDGPMKNYIDLLRTAVGLAGRLLPDVPVPETKSPGDLVRERYGRALTLDEARDEAARLRGQRYRAAQRSVVAKRTRDDIPEGQAFFSKRLATERAEAVKTIQESHAVIIVASQRLEVLNQYIARLEQAEQDRPRVRVGDLPALPPRPAAPPIDYDFPEDMPEDVTITPTDLFGEEIERANNAKKIAQQLLEIEAKAGNDQVALRRLNLEKERDAVISAFRVMGASFEEIERVKAGYDALIGQIEAHKPTIHDTTAAIQFLFTSLAFLPDELQRGGVAALSFVQTGIQVVDTIEFLSNVLTDLPGQLVDVGKKMADLFSKHGTLAVGLIALTAIVGIFMSRAARAKQIEAENRRLREQQYRAQEKLNDAIRDAIDLQGQFARSLSGLDEHELLNEFNSRIHIIERTIGKSLGVIPETIADRANDIRKKLENRYKNDKRFDFLFLNLNEAVNIAHQIEKAKADAEIAARKEQAKIIIAAIERQREAILQALTDAEEAWRAAEIRRVQAEFDYVEAELRSRYSAQLRSVAGDDAATHVVRQRAFADIEKLRDKEAGAIEEALNSVSADFAQRRDETNAFYDGIIAAIEKATTDLSFPDFTSALEHHTSEFIRKWDEGIVMTDATLEGLKPDVAAWTTEFLKNLKAYQAENVGQGQGANNQAGNGDLGEGLPELPKTITIVLPEGMTELPGAITITLPPDMTGLPGAITITLPDGMTGLPGAITITLPDGMTELPGSITITLPEDMSELTDLANLPGAITVTLPTGMTELPGSITITLPEDMTVLPTSIPIVVPEGVVVTDGAPNQSLTDNTGNSNPLGNISTKMDRWITIADTDVAGQALWNSHIKTKMDRWITIADADVAGQALWNSTALTSIQKTATNTDNLSGIKTVLDEIKTNTKQPDRKFEVSIDVGGITVTNNQPLDNLTPEDEEKLALLIADNVTELLKGDNDFSREVSKTEN